jgi:2-polyprenyl-6-methoxyphenol hydroxylase-like FAD-dependent oxidoreductase
MSQESPSPAAPVAIVGGGPVGLMLALFLDRHGVRSVVFNTEDTTRWHPKGSTHNSRTMEHYRRLGISAQVRRLGLPQDHPTDVAYLTRFNGWELARIPMPTEREKMARVARAPATDQVPEPIHRANQMYVEQFLLTHARTRPNIALRFGWRVGIFREQPDGVIVRAEHAADGATEAWRADFLVGCDGGQSLVRRALGIQYAGQDSLKQAFFGGRMVSTHLRAPTLYRDILGTRRAWQYWVVNPELRTAMVALNGDDEFLLWTQHPDPSQPPDDAAITQAMRRCTGADIPVEIVEHRAWTSGVALVSESFGRGRVLLAGDAVHLFTPTGGFGMNTGIEDAANLSWKLAAMVQGWGGAKLLDSYELERKPIAHRNTGAARALARNVGDVKVLPAMEADSPAGEAARREAGAYLASFGEEFASIGVQLGARYDDSPIIVPDGTPPADDFTRYTPTGVPGGRAPHLWLGKAHGAGDSLFDRLGIGFTLLRLGPKPADGAPLVAAARARGVPLHVLEVPLSEARDLYGCDLALVRPDQHIAWRGNRLPADTDHLLAHVVGAEV